MTDYFSYNGKGFLPKYTPGVPAYGQKGAPGNTGDSGESVYYCSYDLSSSEDLNAARLLLHEGKALSNNILYEKEFITYKEGDIILDATGNFYKIILSDKNELDFDISTESISSITSSTGLSISNFSVACVTSFKLKKTEIDPDLASSSASGSSENDVPDFDNDTYSWEVKNPYFVGEYNNKTNSPYIAHKAYYNKFLYGNHIKFSIVSKQELSNCLFNYCIVFPSGEILSTRSSSTSAELFIDNKFVYDNLASSVNTGDSKIIPFADYTYTIDNVKYAVKDLISLYGEDSEYVALAASSYIKTYCKAYVEITNNTDSTYRIDLDDLFFKNSNVVPIIPEDSSTSGEDSSAGNSNGRIDYIEPAKKKTKWEVITYDSPTKIFGAPQTDYVKYINGTSLTLSNGTIPTFRKEFNQFNRFVFKRNDVCNYSKDRIEYMCVYDVAEDVEDPSIYGYYNSLQDTVPFVNRVLRFYFGNITSLTLLIKYKNLAEESAQEVVDEHRYASTDVYIGEPNIPLIDWTGKNNNNAPGIHFLNKISPNKVLDDIDDYTKTLTAGIAEFIVNPSNYDNIYYNDTYNFIDIGFISTDNNASKHSSSHDVSLYVYSLNDDNIEYEELDNGSQEPVLSAGTHIDAPKF